MKRRGERPWPNTKDSVDVKQSNTAEQQLPAASSSPAPPPASVFGNFSGALSWHPARRHGRGTTIYPSPGLSG